MASSPKDSPPDSSTPPRPPTSAPPPQPVFSPPPPPTKDQTSPPANQGNGSGSGNDNASPPPPPPPSNSPSHVLPQAPQLAPPSEGKSSPSSNSNSISIPLTTAIGAAIGVGALFIVMILIVAICSKKKKKPKRADDQMPYYMDPPQGGLGYYKGTPVGGQNIWQDSPKKEHAINILPLPQAAIGGGTPTRGSWQTSPSPLGAIGSATPGNEGWPSPPAPPQVTVNSSDMMSSSNSNSILTPHAPVLPPPHPAVALGFNQCSFSYEELAAATEGFAQSNLLGQGGFGYVHKGVLPSGREIAVKSLKSGSGQGEREFQAEVEIISRVHHRHLVALVGFCMAGDRRMLVYEFIPNKTLEFHLHGKDRHPMDWATRLKIALGAAKGLAYLHEDCHPRIIHRDIKSANILIDYSFEAKVADFGLAKLTQDNNTHVSTRVMGTFGYLAPEYASSGKLTEKSDVFSFGVVLLEIITGRRPLDMSGDHMDENLVEWARPLCSRAIEQGNYNQLADPFLENNYVPHEMARLVRCAAAAIRHSARRRPKMRQIVRALEDDVSLDDLNDVVRTEEGSNFSLRSGSADDEARPYSEDMKTFRKMALDSQVHASTVVGNTSEYGLNPSSSSSSSSSSEGEAGVNTSRAQSP
ncbi:hypothetical protein SLE2022_043900 [Rubroshorea leprosula]